MSYYGQGDYYAAGDPGVFSFLGKVAKGALGFVTGGPVGAAAAVLPSITGSRTTRTGIAVPTFRAGASPPMIQAPAGYTKSGKPRKKYRRMNTLNPKALKRANKRMDGFVKEARKVLKHTNYKLVTKGSTRSKGSRGVITKSEAARALRS